MYFSRLFLVFGVKNDVKFLRTFSSAQDGRVKSA